jgi:hypothetical protein
MLRHINFFFFGFYFFYNYFHLFAPVFVPRVMSASGIEVRNCGQTHAWNTWTYAKHRSQTRALQRDAGRGRACDQVVAFMNPIVWGK